MKSSDIMISLVMALLSVLGAYLILIVFNVRSLSFEDTVVTFLAVIMWRLMLPRGK